jgi:hypothetical protein
MSQRRSRQRERPQQAYSPASDDEEEVLIFKGSKSVVQPSEATIPIRAITLRQSRRDTKSSRRSKSPASKSSPSKTSPPTNRKKTQSSDLKGSRKRDFFRANFGVGDRVKTSVKLKATAVLGEDDLALREAVAAQDHSWSSEASASDVEEDGNA